MSFCSCAMERGIEISGFRLKIADRGVKNQISGGTAGIVPHIWRALADVGLSMPVDFVALPSVPDNLKSAISNLKSAI